MPPSRWGCTQAGQAPPGCDVGRAARNVGRTMGVVCGHAPQRGCTMHVSCIWPAPYAAQPPSPGCHALLPPVCDPHGVCSTRQQANAVTGCIGGHAVFAWSSRCLSQHTRAGQQMRAACTFLG